MISFPHEVREVYERIASRWPDVVFTGSRAIGCPKENSDWDFVVADVEQCDLRDFYEQASEPPGEISLALHRQFTSIRVGVVNLIVDHRGPEQLVNWMAATDYCAERQVFDKEERIKVFDSFGAG